MSGPADAPGAALREAARRLRERRLELDPSSEPTLRELRLDKGADGELELGEMLADHAWAYGGIGLLHSLKFRGRWGDIDHVVVGPAGVTVVDAKNWDGPVSVRNGVLRCGRYAKRRELDRIARHVQMVRDALGAAGQDGVPVTGVMCLVDGFAPDLAWVDGIGVASPDGAIAHAARRGDLQVHEMRAIQETLSERFRVTGGCQLATRPLHEPPVAITPPPPGADRAPARWRLLAHRRLAANVSSLLLVVVVAVATPGAHAGRMTRAELRRDLPRLRTLAERRAHGPVGTPSVTAGASEFRLVYRRGGRCRVVIRVSRVQRRVPLARASGCARRTR